MSGVKRTRAAASESIVPVPARVSLAWWMWMWVVGVVGVVSDGASGDGASGTLSTSSTSSTPRPIGEHLAFGTAANTMTVAWHTDGPAGTAEVCWWRLDDVIEAESVTPSSSSIPLVASQIHTTTTTTTTTTTVGESASYLISPNASAYVHRVTIGPLTSGVYGYIAQHANGATGLQYNFTFRDPMDQSAVKMLFFGDSGNSAQWSDHTVPTVAAEVADGGVAAIIHTGTVCCAWDYHCPQTTPTPTTSRSSTAGGLKHCSGCSPRSSWL
jgi:hypothetical protein